MRAVEIVKELEIDYGRELDGFPNVLCDGDTCRHSECECWDSFKYEVERILKEESGRSV